MSSKSSSNLFSHFCVIEYASAAVTAVWGEEKSLFHIKCPVFNWRGHNGQTEKVILTIPITLCGKQIRVIYSIQDFDQLIGCFKSYDHFQQIKNLKFQFCVNEAKNIFIESG